MKKQDGCLVILFIFIVSCSFLSLQTNKVTGQTDSSSSSSSSGEATSSSSGEVSSTSSGDVTSTSSSSGEVTPSSSSGSPEITLNEAFAGIWKAKVEKLKPQSTSSSSGNVSSTSSSSSGEISSSSSSGEIVSSSSSSGDSGEVSSSSSSSSGEISTSSSGSIEAIRKTHLDIGNKGASVITFKLCVIDGKLEGIVHQGGAFLMGAIKEQNIISENEIEFTAEDKDGKTAMIHLNLTGDRQFVGTFADGHEFEGRKLNKNRGCLASGKVPGKPSGSKGPKKGPISGTLTDPPINGMGIGMSNPSNEGIGMSTPPNMSNPPNNMSGPTNNDETSNGEPGTGTPPSMDEPTSMSEEPDGFDEVPSGMSGPPFDEPPGHSSSMGMA